MCLLTELSATAASLSAAASTVCSFVHYSLLDDLLTILFKLWHPYNQNNKIQDKVKNDNWVNIRLETWLYKSPKDFRADSGKFCPSGVKKPPWFRSMIYGWTFASCIFFLFSTQIHTKKHATWCSYPQIDNIKCQ